MKRISTGLLTGIVAIAAFALITVGACKKNDPANCFNAQLQRDYEKVSCSTICTETYGCDGKLYCNACTAAKVGIYAN